MLRELPLIPQLPHFGDKVDRDRGQGMAEPRAVSVRDTVSFHNVRELFGKDGQPKDTTGCNAAAKTMLDQLAWRGTALREAREKHPYQS